MSIDPVRVEANFSGLPPESVNWSINKYGDLMRGAGRIFSGSREMTVADGVVSSFRASCCKSS